MSFRTRMLLRNHQTRATFVAAVELKNLDGEPIAQVLKEVQPRLYDDMTIKVMLDSGLPLRQFTSSADCSELQKTISIDQDLQVVADTLEERGYDISKTLASENKRMSQQIVKVGNTDNNNNSNNTNNE